MGKGMKKIFTTSPEKRRRRRRRKGRSGNNEEDDDGSYVSNDSSLEGNMQSAAAANVHPNGDGRRSMLGDGGNGVGLPRVIEGENEDYDSDSPLKNSIHSKQQRNSKSTTSTNLFQTQKKNRNHALTNRSLTTRSRIAPLPAASVDNEQTADPLSLVILLVDPVSLRFELLSLDFDLVAAMVTAQRKWTKKEKKKRKKGFRRQTKKNKTNTTPALLSLALTVQDVLDQITPDSLTEATLQRTLRMNHHVPIGLIDRTEQIHYGAVSLDEACAARPLRTPTPTTSTDGGAAVVRVQPSSLWKLTYTGEAHRDVLVGYLGDPTVEGGGAGKKRTTGERGGGTAGRTDAADATERIRKAIELAKPILNDTNVVQMMEANGYNLTGWSEKASTSTNTTGSTTTHDNGDGVPGHRGSNTTVPATGAQQRSMAMLQAPLPPNKRMKKWMEYTIVKVFVAVAVIVVSTLTAWSIVAGGVHVLPSISSVEANISAGDSLSISIPSTTSAAAAAAASVSSDGIVLTDGLGADAADAIAAHYHKRSARTTTTRTKTIVLTDGLGADAADAIAAHYHKRSTRTTTTRTTKTETIRTN